MTTGQTAQTTTNWVNRIKNVIGGNQITWNGNDVYLRYPTDIFDTTKHTVLMTIAPYYEEILGGEKTKQEPQVELTDLPPIFMMLPANFQENYSHNYENETLFLNVREVLSGDRRGQLAGGNNNLPFNLGTIGASVASTVGGALNFAQGAASSVRSVAHGGLRAATELLYQSPNLRQFSFEFKFQPRDKEEADQIVKILKYFKFLSAPDFVAGAQRYPAVFDIEFSAKEASSVGVTSLTANDDMNTIFTFTKMALVDYTYNPDPEGGKMMLTEDGFPISSLLTLTFQEIRYLDRETILKEQSDLTGKTTQNIVNQRSN